ncbi:MAG: nickel-dependent hydrogenase large subunit [gamma proteobacterium endosymbiont of Lamellibrachia anaximandri]|nr:nickel-dependent hydrogenase large subunit [gamma proteobacterium endosymbiont of Lamellibrachia anaximandri]MBL3535569.1 nickel-dependent hydrogenase large subunit [gamma proteobacterium endosymbiont of Lamellibrachia anaximandri]
MASKREIHINVPVLTRVEGEGALEFDVVHGVIQKLNLRIFEPPRLFEKFVEGYEYDQVIDMVARICGICPVAYQMSAVQAFERLFGVDPGTWVRDMRRVMYCGEWLQSHALHVHLLAAPDFFGFESAIAMAEKHPEVVRRGLRLQGLGNDLITLFGGRSVHPVGVRVGGFYKAPAQAAVADMVKQLEEALPQAEALVRWCAELDFPHDEQAFTSVALSEPGEYAIGSGRLVSGQGLDIDISHFESHFEEFQVPHSTALHTQLEGRPYLTGPLARLNLNFRQLPKPVRAVMEDCGIHFPSHNMFHSILARAIEIHLVIYEALQLLQAYERPDVSAVQVRPRAGTAFGCTEAPRGFLWHRYDVDERGDIRRARIVPPTSQNQARIEQDLCASLESFGLDHEDDALRQRAEQVIRNYDPCISCATHFLKLKVSRC